MNERNLRRQREEAKTENDMEKLADVENKLGLLYLQQKRLDEALEAFKNLLKTSKRLNNILYCAIAHRKIADVYVNKIDYSTAIEHQKLYLEEAIKLNDETEKLRAFNALGHTRLLAASIMIKALDNDKKIEILKLAKNDLNKGLILCDKYENRIEKSELITMKPRLILNYGRVLDEQNNCEEALQHYERAAELCEEHDLEEDLHRVNLAFVHSYKKLGETKLAFKHLDQAANVKNYDLKVRAIIEKAELLLVLGKSVNAQKILQKLYKSGVSDPGHCAEVEKLLRIAAVLSRSKKQLLIENDPSSKLRLYEKMGDAAVVLTSLKKAAKYYRLMLSCAEECKSPRLGVALTCLLKTLDDLGKTREAIPYAYRELEICPNARERCKSAVYLADMLIDIHAKDHEIQGMLKKARIFANECQDTKLQWTAVKNSLVYLQNTEGSDIEEIRMLEARLQNLSEPPKDAESEDEEVGKIGADINLDELSEVNESSEEETIDNGNQKFKDKSLKLTRSKRRLDSSSESEVEDNVQSSSSITAMQTQYKTNEQSGNNGTAKTNGKITPPAKITADKSVIDKADGSRQPCLPKDPIKLKGMPSKTRNPEKITNNRKNLSFKIRTLKKKELSRQQSVLSSAATKEIDVTEPGSQNGCTTKQTQKSLMQIVHKLPIDKKLDNVNNTVGCNPVPIKDKGTNVGTIGSSTSELQWNKIERSLTNVRTKVSRAAAKERVVFQEWDKYVGTVSILPEAAKRWVTHIANRREELAAVAKVRESRLGKRNRPYDRRRRAVSNEP